MCVDAYLCLSPCVLLWGEGRRGEAEEQFRGCGGAEIEDGGDGDGRCRDGGGDREE